MFFRYIDLFAHHFTNIFLLEGAMKGITYKTAVMIVMTFVGQPPSDSDLLRHMLYSFAAKRPHDTHEFVGSNKRNELPSFPGSNP